MERELWPVLYHVLREVGSRFHQKYVTIPGWVLVAVQLWAALRDRPASWACRQENWTTTRLRPLRIPSDSTLSRRGHGVASGLLWRALRRRGQCGLLSLLDGKSLPVGGASKDRDARSGPVAGGRMGRGDKRHALWGSRLVPEAWQVRPLNEAEVVLAVELLAQAPRGGYLLADGNYDASQVFDAAAAAGCQRLVPMPHPHAGQGHHDQSPYRQRCIERMRSFCGPHWHRHRGHIERLFGNATCFAGGLGPLPAWVRRPRRVRTWVWAKLLINAARIIYRQRLTA